MDVMPIHQRLAELWLVNKRRALTPEEMNDIQHCLAANAQYVWKMAYLENLSLIASMINDVDWQHEVCLEIDQVQTGQTKKSDHRKRGTDK